MPSIRILCFALAYLSIGQAQALDLRQALNDAATSGDGALVTELIRQGANIRAADARGWTALAYAAYFNEAQAAQALVEAGASAWTPEPATSPLAIAVAAGSATVIPALLSKSIPPAAYNDALSLAAGDRNQGILDLLIKDVGLDATQLGALGDALSERFMVDPASAGTLQPDQVLAAVTVCRNRGVYATQRCLSAETKDHIPPRARTARIEECDRLAAASFDPDRPVGVRGVVFAEMDPSQAIAACSDAVHRSPDVARFHVGLGRAYLRAQSLDTAQGPRFWSDADYEFRRASELGSKVGLYLRGTMRHDDPVRPDYAEAGRLFGQAADAGLSVAVDGLGIMYRDGQGVEREPRKAAVLFLRASEAGDSAGMVHAAILYLEGTGVAKDPDLAYLLLKKAEGLGAENVQYWIGYCLALNVGVKANPQEARQYLLPAAASDARAALLLSRLYQNGSLGGIGILDHAEAIKWLNQAAALGSADANFEIARKHLDAKEYAQALPYYQKAVQLGDLRAAFDLGGMYSSGRGVSKNYITAHRLWQNAANAGQIEAMANLGSDYAKGEGVGQDYGQSLFWFRKAASLGNAFGMRGLGWLYDNGHGVPRDASAARLWYGKAAALGDDQARINLRKLKP